MYEEFSNDPVILPQYRADWIFIYTCDMFTLNFISQEAEWVELYYDPMVIAAEDDAVILFGVSTSDGKLPTNTFFTKLVYLKKQGEFSVYAAPPSGKIMWQWETQKSISLPVFVFDDMPDAVRAELDLVIPHFPLQDGDSPQKDSLQYTLQSHREKEGYFSFIIHEESKYSLKNTGSTLEAFASLSDYRNYYPDVVTATVKLYDEKGQLLCEEKVLIKSLQRERCDQVLEAP